MKIRTCIIALIIFANSLQAQDYKQLYFINSILEQTYWKGKVDRVKKYFCEFRAKIYTSNTFWVYSLGTCDFSNVIFDITDEVVPENNLIAKQYKGIFHLSWMKGVPDKIYKVKIYKDNYLITM